jgi:hypothetical protein
LLVIFDEVVFDPPLRIDLGHRAALRLPDLERVVLTG